MKPLSVYVWSILLEWGSCFAHIWAHQPPIASAHHTQISFLCEELGASPVSYSLFCCFFQ